MFLPPPGFFFAIVDDGACPFVSAAGFDYIVLHLGGYEALALAGLEILLAAPPEDEQLPDQALFALGHFEIKSCEAAFHYRPPLLAVHPAMLSANAGIAGVDGVAGQGLRIDILPHQPAQALLVKGAAFDEAHQVMVGFLTEDLFLCQCIFLFFVIHISLI